MRRFFCSIQKKASMWKLCFVFALLLGFISLQEAGATHIRAGEITGVRTGFLSYQFTIRIYTDNSSSADSPQLTINFGDNTTSVAPRVNRFDIGNNTSVNVYQVNHTYAAPGSYRVFFVEENRNAGVLNMDNSVLTPFSVETFVFINSAVGLNDTPILTVDPIDLACVGNRFKHNPGAFDPDGDSLSFKLVIPFQSGTQPVNNYRDPNNPAFNGETEDGLPPGIFSIDPLNGELIWDSPGTAGEYNIAFIVEEWRNGIRIGFVKRDMQIIVNDCPNRRPRLVVPNVCVVANEDPNEDTNIINEIIRATDPDIPLQNLVISSDQDQGVYNPAFFNTTATFTFTPSPQTSPAEATFRWDTRCEHVREQPYLVVFKAEDDPIEQNNTALVDIQTMVITVKGPPPVNLAATPQGRATDLSWDDYRLQCPGFSPAQFDAMEIVIWRREGCNAMIACEQDPAMLGLRPLVRWELKKPPSGTMAPFR
ncbi:MAG: hypothetical protein HC913_01115 [Microscillaceae bacterium]|nr:hypothetical protein [Microscillaceae bacterium]